jgi:hypothetical protein
MIEFNNLHEVELKNVIDKKNPKNKNKKTRGKHQKQF